MAVFSGPGGADSTASPPEDKPYHSKRPHKKSRTGCRNCKKRKVKCDEARPTCRNCVLRKTECNYPSPASSHPHNGDGDNHHHHHHHHHHHTSPASPSSTSGSTTSRSQTPGHSGDEDFGSALVLKEPLFVPASNRDSVDMKLLWFYTTNTFQSFATQAGTVKRIDDILKVRIPALAFESPFLMDCLLGTSALQLQHLGQDIAPSRALHYRARAFEGYRKAIEEGRPETFPALIATSLLLTALSSQMFREDGTKDLYIIDWMVVWRGIGLMIDVATPQTVWESGLAELFFRPPIDLDKAARHIPNNLLFMISSIHPGDPEYDDVATYYDSLKYLGSLYSELAHGFGPIMTLRVVTWFTFVPKAFVELGRQRRPRALVILAHYLMFVKAVQTLWWIDGIADREISGIARYLGEDWAEEIAGPRLALLLTDRTDVARLILGDPEWESPVNYVSAPTRDPRAASLTWVDDSGKRIKSMPRHVGALYPPDPAPRVTPWQEGVFHPDPLILAAPNREFTESVLGAIESGFQDVDMTR